MMLRGPFQILADAQARANQEPAVDANGRDREYPWIVATLILSHVGWYLEHGVAAGPDSLAGKYYEGGVDLAFGRDQVTPDTPQTGVLRNGQ